MKKTYILLCVMLVFNLQAPAQELKIIERLIIQEAEHNGVDYSEYNRANNARLVFYEDKERNTILCNEWDNSKSFGEVHLIGHEHHGKTIDQPSYTLYRFLWAYENTYDDKKGFCLIKLRETYLDNETTFEMAVITDDFEYSVYKGYADKL